MKKIPKKVYLIISSLLLIGIIFTLSYIGITNRIREGRNKVEIKEFEYETYSINGNIGTTLVTLTNEKGLERVTYTDWNTNKPMEVFPRGKTKFAFDYKMEDQKSYEIEVELKNGETKKYTIYYEIPRIKGEYTLVDGLYLNKPDTTGLIKEKTRYLYLDDNENLVPGNWITDEEPAKWYNYKTQEWANIYVESNGIENYYVWIPRYCYKIDTENSVTGNERMDVKFINTYNEYIDGETRRKINMG